MARFRISYLGGPVFPDGVVTEVEADHWYLDSGNWFDFYDSDTDDSNLILTVRAGEVRSIHRFEE